MKGGSVRCDVSKISCPCQNFDWASVGRIVSSNRELIELLIGDRPQSIANASISSRKYADSFQILVLQSHDCCEDRLEGIVQRSISRDITSRCGNIDTVGFLTRSGKGHRNQKESKNKNMFHRLPLADVFILAFFLIAMSLPGSCQETNCIYVSTSGSDVSGNGTLNNPFETIFAAVMTLKNKNLETVCVFPGAYTGVGNALWTITDQQLNQLTIRAYNPPNTGPVKILAGATYLGNITSYGTSLHLEGIWIQDVTLAMFGAPLVISNSTFTGATNSYGEALVSSDSSITITNTTFIGLTQYDDLIMMTGGSSNKTLTMSGCKFESCTKIRSIINMRYGHLAIEESEFIANLVRNNGQMIFGSEVLIERSDFRNNSQLDSLPLISGKDLDLVDVTFDCNSINGKTYLTPLGATGDLQYENITINPRCPIECQDGMYSPKPFGQCLSCKGNEYAPTPNSTRCIPCPIGYITGPYVCKICTYGTYQADAVCKWCPEGQYQPQQGQTECILCPAGKYKANIGDQGCTPCGRYYSTSKVGSTTCDEPTAALETAIILPILLVAIGGAIMGALYWRAKKMSANVPKDERTSLI
eukprot:TRINITY_DN3982_c0_g1_i1.p1 TRINITY_DN3982_c0_g1~~TRINITY_DN3982_c0_g1_i1.p1  ORF type:complete len:588 (+),score=78.50 TRINITY_DN3982_c0_g1_i1:1100-2863(+)